MHERSQLIVRTLAELAALAPLGYRVGVHIRFAKPLFSRSTMSREWCATYDKNSFALRDPMVFWGIGKTGRIRWSEIALPDPFGVMREAAEHGLKYGATVSCGKITSRTLAGVARDDREFTDGELDAVAEVTLRLHEVAATPEGLTPPLLDALRLAGNGTPAAEAAASLGIDEATYLSRLSEVSAEIGANDTEEAVRMARDMQLI